jgi:hypothetical protein
MGVRAWIKRQRRWRRDHIAAFSLATQCGPDGITLFQRQCLNAVSDMLPLERFNRVAMTQEEGEYFEAAIGSSGAKAYIYPNEAMIFGGAHHSWFEEWDYLTPNDLIEAFKRECVARAA